METIKLSIIIPVYNVEKYLTECLDSILPQCNEFCEIILVDDGSTDSSSNICDLYEERYKSIRVLHKENGGLSSARNAGLEVANGEYIAYVDSDDRVAKGALRGILDWIDNGGADLCFMEAVKFFPNGKREPLGDAIERTQIKGKSREAVFAHLATRPKYPGSACTKIYRHKMLIDNNLYFPRDKRHCEDLGYCLDCLLQAKTFDALTIPYYEYRQNREGSITNKVNAKSFWDMALFVKETVQKTTVEKKPKNKLNEYAMSFAAYEYSIILWQYSRLSAEDKKKAKIFLKDYKWVMRYGASKKTKVVSLLQNIAGSEIASKVLNFYMTHR